MLLLKITIPAFAYNLIDLAVFIAYAVPPFHFNNLLAIILVN